MICDILRCRSELCSRKPATKHFASRTRSYVWHRRRLLRAELAPTFDIVADFREQSSLLRLASSQAFASRARSYVWHRRRLSRAELAPTFGIIAPVAPEGAPTGLGLASIPGIPHRACDHRPTPDAHRLYHLLSKLAAVASTSNANRRFQILMKHRA